MLTAWCLYLMASRWKSTRHRILVATFIMSQYFIASLTLAFNIVVYARLTTHLTMLTSELAASNCNMESDGCFNKVVQAVGEFTNWPVYVTAVSLQLGVLIADCFLVSILHCRCHNNLIGTQPH